MSIHIISLLYEDGSLFILPDNDNNILGDTPVMDILLRNLYRVFV
jgi:hypothetical protein